MSEFTAVFENKEVQDFIDNLERKLFFIKEGKKQYVGVISALVFQDVMDHFKDEEGSEGPWQEWSQAYGDMRRGIHDAKRTSMLHAVINAKTRKQKTKISKKLKAMGTPKILQISGKLRNNFLPTKWKSSGGGIYWYNNAQTKSGFPYAFAHNEGGPKLPKRDFMWLSDKGLEKISEQTLQFMMEKSIGR